MDNLLLNRMITPVEDAAGGEADKTRGKRSSIPLYSRIWTYKKNSKYSYFLALFDIQFLL